jgi:hypothetical protein
MSSQGLVLFVCMRHTAILIEIEGRFQVFQRFSGSKLVLKTVGIGFAALSYYENGSIGMYAPQIRIHTLTHTHTHSHTYIEVQSCTCPGTWLRYDWDMLALGDRIKQLHDAACVCMYVCECVCEYEYAYVRTHVYDHSWIELRNGMVRTHVCMSL